MEDFFNAGGLSAMLARMTDLLNTDCMTVNGKTLGEQIAGAEVIDNEVIRTRENPVAAAGGTCLLRGNLAPSGCVIKSIAADPKLLQHRGPAIVFDNYPAMKQRIHDPDLNVTRKQRIDTCEAPARWAHRISRNGECCRSPRNCWRQASVTWCV